MVSGHDHESVTKILRGTNATIIENRRYRETNSIASAFTCARYFGTGEDLLIWNGDSYYEEPLISSLIDDPRSPILLVDRDRRRCADVKVLIRDGVVIQYGKELDEPADAESADLAKLSSSHALIYGQVLRALQGGNHDEMYWEDALFHMRGVEILAKDTGGLFWADIDRQEDYERILSHVNGRMNSMNVPSPRPRRHDTDSWPQRP